MSAEMPWRCVNPACRQAAAPAIESRGDSTIPRCACGSPMKRQYSRPVFRYLDFLRLEEPVLVEPAAHDEPRE